MLVGLSKKLRQESNRLVIVTGIGSYITATVESTDLNIDHAWNYRAM